MKLKTLDDLTELEKLALIPISYSRLNTYDMCKAMYYYNYIQQVEQDFSPPAVLGNVIHAVLEDEVGNELDEARFLDRYEYHLEEYDPDKLIDEELRTAGIEMLYEFIDRHKGEHFSVFAKELPFEMVIGRGFVRGYIDLVLRTESGGFHLIDWKSGKFEVSKKQIPNNLQLGIYALALYSKNAHLKDFHSELYYLRSGRRKGHTFTIPELEVVYNKVHVLVDEIIEQCHFPVQPHTGWQPCGFCSFAKKDVCKSGWSYREKRKRRG